MATPAHEPASEQPWFLKSTFPVYVPAHPALKYDAAQFEAFLFKDVEKFANPVSQSTSDQKIGTDEVAKGDLDETTTLVSGALGTSTAEIRAGVKEMAIERLAEKPQPADPDKPEHPFMEALHSANSLPDRDMENMMQTQNADLAYRSTTEPLVDLFAELEDVVSGPRLRELLGAAWHKDPLSTLKIIFNARSIHLGKSSRPITYKCFGWLAQNHPLTLLVNLQWLSRPVIEKKLGEKKDSDNKDDMVIVESEKDEADPTRFDIKNGVAHGYWKDLLNILALAADGKLDVLANPRDLLNIENKGKKGIVWDQAQAKKIRKERKAARHANAVRLFEDNSFYRALHLTVARLFAEQIRSDLNILRSDDKKAARQVSMCAKWTPSSGLFHDKHTFIVSSIAEILHPQSEFPTITERELYLRHAREAYRKDISALRKALEVVERDIAAGNFANIKYDHVPSLAMNRYTGLFAKKDADRFEEYITQVAEGKKSISGAVLLPSQLVAAERAAISDRSNAKDAKTMIQKKLHEINAKVADGQWRTLVQRIKDSGKLENSMAVCDVSGSMSYPVFPDGTAPVDSAIGLSLLLAEVTAPPFGGSFISFSEKPSVQKVEGATLREKIANLEKSEWGMSTDFVAVFRDLILPLAEKHKIKQEDMVKQLFVFSDMQFDEAESDPDKWTTSFERIRADYKKAGYELPTLIFWNLAGGRAGVTGIGDATAPKPVTSEQEGTALVSGYSQGMLKVFLDNGSFEDAEAQEEIVEELMVEGEGEEGVVQVTKNQKVDPMSTMRKAISHKAYSMLKVVD